MNFIKKFFNIILLHIIFRQKDSSSLVCCRRMTNDQKGGYRISRPKMPCLSQSRPRIKRGPRRPDFMAFMGFVVCFLPNHGDTDRLHRTNRFIITPSARTMIIPLHYTCRARSEDEEARLIRTRTANEEAIAK
jgi:hypothetical protein